LLGEIDLAHPAFAEQTNDPIAPEHDGSDQRISRLGRIRGRCTRDNRYERSAARTVVRRGGELGTATRATVSHDE
jgi:hypothetical protein